VIRGAGASVLHLEEVAFMTQLRDSLKGALLVTKGGGKIVGLSTAQAGTYAASLALDVDL
jgi:hypothetical protein